MFADSYRGRRVLLTGHTGFKGSWLALWLRSLGAIVTGVALRPDTQPNHWGLLALEMDSREIDIRDAAALAAVVREVCPEVVFHLAAQPLVRASYADPLATWSTNVMGTAHLLEALRSITQLRAVVVVTSDKCYENREWHQAYRETDALGGHDPYSASKAATELLVASYRRAFFEPAGQVLLATARAGNVIGGGDWAADRLIPDLVRAIAAGQPLAVRAPGAVRPWQHVLDPLSGYLLLGERLLQGDAQAASAWNFGPGADASHTVAQVLDQFTRLWPGAAWQHQSGHQVHEAGLLRLDSTRAQAELGWRPVWDIGEALAATARWYQAQATSAPLPSARQLEQFSADAAAAGLAWAQP